MARFGLYVTLSALAAIAVVVHAVHTRRQFYPTVVYLVSSKVSVAVLGNAVLAALMVFATVVRKIFLGKLSETESETVEDHLKFVIPETCLALTLFREELSSKILLMFACLLVVKFFHWVTATRVAEMDTMLRVTNLDHFRLVMLMGLLMILDSVAVSVFAFLVIEHGPSVLLLFALESATLAVTIVGVFFRYVLYVVESRTLGAWEGRKVYTMYLELVTEFIHLFMYSLYFVVMFAYYSFPFPLIREVLVSMQNFHRRVMELTEYRRIQKAFASFPDATAEELADRPICIVCREDMQQAKKLPCGHLFHAHCLKDWLTEQQVCPLCSTPLNGPRAAPGAAAAAGAGAAGAAAAAAAQPVAQPAAAQPAAAQPAAAQPAAAQPAAPAVQPAAAAPRAPVTPARPAAAPDVAPVTPAASSATPSAVPTPAVAAPAAGAPTTPAALPTMPGMPADFAALQQAMMQNMMAGQQMGGFGFPMDPTMAMMNPMFAGGMMLPQTPGTPVAAAPQIMPGVMSPMMGMPGMMMPGMGMPGMGMPGMMMPGMGMGMPGMGMPGMGMPGMGMPGMGMPGMGMPGMGMPGMGMPGMMMPGMGMPGMAMPGTPVAPPAPTPVAFAATSTPIVAPAPAPTPIAAPTLTVAPTTPVPAPAAAPPSSGSSTPLPHTVPDLERSASQIAMEAFLRRRARPTTEEEAQ